jgi:hypothetical protein
MVSRRRLLQTTGTAMLAAVTGCASSDGDAATESTEEPTTAATGDSTTEREGQRHLTGEQVAASDVPDGATVSVTTPELYSLVLDAASADGRVDLQSGGDADRDETLALGQFEYVEFRGETYEPTASFAAFAAEAAYKYKLEAVDDGEVEEDDEVTSYDSLNDAERAAVDRLLNGSVTIGHHEDRTADDVRDVTGYEYVRVDGQTYRPQTTVGDYGPHHMLRLDAADPGEDAQVVRIADDVPDAGWRGAVTTVAGEDRTLRLDEVSDPDELAEYVESVDYFASVAAVATVSVVGEAE